MNRISAGILDMARAMQFGLHMRSETQEMRDQGWANLRSCAMQTDILGPVTGSAARRTLSR